MRKMLPRVIRIEPSALCNLRCRHCPTGISHEHNGTVMSDEMFDMIATKVEASINTVKTVVLYHGGEPLINKRLPSMIKRFKENGVEQVKIVTNGMLLTEKIAKELILSGLDVIEFSLDGTTIEENDWLRCGCDGNKVINNIKRFIEIKAEIKAEREPVIVLSSIQFSNEAKPEYLYKLFERELETNEIERIFVGRAMAWCDKVSFERKGDFLLEEMQTNEYKRYCDHIENTMTIRSNGNVVACCYDLTDKLVLGNVLSEDLVDIWCGSVRAEYLEAIKSGRPKGLCAQCNTIGPICYLVKNISL